MFRTLGAILLVILSVTVADARCRGPQNVSWYVDRHTASGEPYTYKESTCAHPTAPMGARFRVTDNRTKKSVTCRVNDRGPNKWTKCKLDVNEHAAQKLAMKKRGVIHAKIEAVKSTAHHGRAAKLDQLVPRLAAKVSEIIASCGSRITPHGGHRPGAIVRYTNHRSLHSMWPSRAADVAGNPRCIYAHLKGWPGGYSIDYGAVQHVHISYSPRGGEWGARFAHYGHGRHRYAALR